jgi:hypothetical protein
VVRGANTQSNFPKIRTKKLYHHLIIGQSLGHDALATLEDLHRPFINGDRIDESVG